VRRGTFAGVRRCESGIGALRAARLRVPPHGAAVSGFGRGAARPLFCRKKAAASARFLAAAQKFLKCAPQTAAGIDFFRRQAYNWYYQL